MQYDTIITSENLNEKKVNVEKKTVEVVIGKKFEMQKYSETPPYGHLSNTVTSLLRPLFFWPPGIIAIHKKPSLIRPPRLYGHFFFCPIGDRINGVPL